MHSCSNQAGQNDKTMMTVFHHIYSSSTMLLQYQSINQTMGSAPSYEGQEDNLGLSVRKSRHSKGNRNETLRASKLRQIQGQNQDQNPQHKNQIKEKDNRERNGHLKEKNQSIQDPNLNRSKLENYERIAKENLPKRTPHKEDEAEQENEEQNRAAIRDALQRKLRHQLPTKTKDHNTSRHHPSEQQQTPVVQQRHRVRHYAKDYTRNQHNIQLDLAHNPNTVKKTHRKSEQIDYHQYDSAHIRHKAVQEVRQMEHPIHPIKQKEAIYEHEKLYPNLLKNYHADPHEEHRNISNNRHLEHQRNAEEQYYEQPHNINIYKRHRILLHGHSHEQEQLEEQPEPKSNPIKGVHRHHEENNLQKSMEVRGNEHQQMNDIRKSMNIRVKPNALDGQVTKRRKESANIQEENNQIPQNANFKRRKPSMPPVQERRELVQAKNKLKELETKSIAEINKQNEFNITEYDADPQELVTCRQGCGRKFHSNRIQKHEIICRKVFQEKRKQFNAQDQRIISKQHKKLLKKNTIAKNEEETKKRSNVTKWKAQSIALRAHIKMGMDENYVPTEEEKDMLNQEHHIDIVNCPYCGRNFNKNSGKTHVPFCKAQNQKQIEKERFEKHPRGAKK